MKEIRRPSLAETEYSQENISAIRTQLDSIERLTRLSIAANPRHQEHIAELFEGRAGSAELYLALEDGPKSQDDLIRVTGRSQATVSKVCNYLHENNLISRVPALTEGTKVLWRWHDMERTLGISRVARRIAKARPASNDRPDREGVEAVRPDA
jgi:DNA-binding HxlR family transcriptional regulator